MGLAKHRFLIATCLLCLVASLYNLKDTHDWGGDFAMYLAQAQNIVDGVPQDETGYIYNPDNAVLSPPAYPVGYPLLLAPVVAIWGTDILPAVVVNSLFLMGFGLLIFFFIRRWYAPVVAFLSTALVILNPWMLNFKQEIRSDIPFAFLMLAFILALTSNWNSKYWRYALVGCLAGLAMLVRSAGMVLFVFLMMQVVFHGVRFIRSKSEEAKAVLLKNLVALLSGALLFAVVDLILLPNGSVGGYMAIGNEESFFEMVFLNLTYYLDVLVNFFDPMNETLGFLSTTMMVIVVGAAVVGFFWSLLDEFTIYDRLVILYMGLLLIYPYRASGFRFLIPVLPFVVFYVLKASKIIYRYLERPKWAYPLALVFIVGTYSFGISNIYQHRNAPIEGPLLEEDQACFEFISEHTATDARLAFNKPRVLALYTDRSCFALNKEATPETAYAQFVENHITHFVRHSLLPDGAMDGFLLTYSNEVELVWSNEKMEVYTWAD